jgi:hypothetical protein
LRQGFDPGSRRSRGAAAVHKTRCAEKIPILIFHFISKCYKYSQDFRKRRLQNRPGLRSVFMAFFCRKRRSMPRNPPSGSCGLLAFPEAPEPSAGNRKEKS